jgi:hypothetical protein
MEWGARVAAGEISEAAKVFLAERTTQRQRHEA